VKVTTLEIIRTVLKTDETITTEERARIIRFLTTPVGAPPVVPKPPARIVSFKEAAARLAVERRTIYHYCRKGILIRAKISGKKSASGVTEESLTMAIGGERITYVDQKN
jgi:hypothetical protein